MPRVYRNSADVLVERAMEPELRARTQSTADTVTKPQQRRLIYGGTMPAPPSAERAQGTTLPPVNRRYTKRRVSAFNIILMLMGTAAAIVLYIGNVIAVNQLVNDIHKIDIQLQSLLSEQETIKARINQMSSLERVRVRAEDELGLKNPTDAPALLTVDEEKIQTIEEATREH